VDSSPEKPARANKPIRFYCGFQHLRTRRNQQEQTIGSGGHYLT
jgi:hypothetical protein